MFEPMTWHGGGYRPGAEARPIRKASPAIPAVCIDQALGQPPASW
jgi:hypothetical protein